MTYNIHGWRDSDHCCNFDRIVKVIKDVQPDILCLNEVLHPFAHNTRRRPYYSSSMDTNNNNNNKFSGASDEPPPQQQQSKSSTIDNIIEEYYRRVQNNMGRDYPIDPSLIPSESSGAATTTNNDDDDGGDDEGDERSISFLHALAEATNLTNMDFVMANDNSYFGKGVSFGNAILTKSCHPIIDTCHILLEVEEGDQDLGGQKRDFVDPRSFGVARIQILIEDSNNNNNKNNNNNNNNQHDQNNDERDDDDDDDDDNCSCCIIGVAYGHLDHKSEELREKQIIKAIQKIRTFFVSVKKDNDDDKTTTTTTTPHVICGDLNTFQKSDYDESGWESILDLYSTNGWPEPPERSLVLDALTKEGYLDSFYYHHHNHNHQNINNNNHNNEQQEEVLPNPTSWTNNPLMRIDHIYVKQQQQQQQQQGTGTTTSKGDATTITTIVPKRHYRLETDASDHFPVILEAMILETTTTKRDYQKGGFSDL